MLQHFKDFREKLDRIMILDIHKRIVLFGYDTFTGRFIRWYAKYYHNIECDYLVGLGYQRGISHEHGIFTRELLEFDYKDVNNATIWFCTYIDDDLVKYTENKDYRDWIKEIYDNDYMSSEKNMPNDFDVYNKRKVGKRDVQFLEYLEWKYDCNFLQTVVAEDHSYSCSTQKEIFPILDAVHLIPENNDAVFDFGCGKGGALVTFLDYGFKHVGGVEFDEGLYNVCASNAKKLGLQDEIEVIFGNALDMKLELDAYNWFYFFSPLPKELYSIVIENIVESYNRKKRRIHIIAFNPTYSQNVEDTGIFRLRTQVNVNTLKRVVDVFETFNE